VAGAGAASGDEAAGDFSFSIRNGIGGCRGLTAQNTGGI
jgi:hypothetical protein